MASATNVTVKLTNVRLSFPSLFQPKKDKEDPSKKPKYEATFILHKKINAADIKKVQAAIDACRKDAVLKGKKPGKVCLRDGADTENRAEMDGYGPDVMTVSARNHVRPGVVDRDLSPLVDTDGKPYSGCFVNATFDVYPYYNPKGGPGIAASLRAVQFLKDGEPLGGGAPVDATKEFDAVEEESVDTSNV